MEQQGTRKKGVHLHHHHVTFGLIIVVILIVIIALLIKPALLGYKLSKQFEEIDMTPAGILKSLEEIKSDLLVSETQLEASRNLNSQYLVDLESEKNTSFICWQNTEAFENRMKQRDRDYSLNLTEITREFNAIESDMQDSINELELRVQSLNSGIEKLGKQSADNICCKGRVDDFSIDSYSILDGKVICITGGEDKINCR